MNRYLQTIVVAPMATAHKPYPTRVSIEHNTKTGWIALDQIRTIDRLRIVKNLGVLTADEIAQVKRVFQAVFVD
jgi:mRNA interferase MazF